MSEDQMVDLFLMGGSIRTVTSALMKQHEDDGHMLLRGPATSIVESALRKRLSSLTRLNRNCYHCNAFVEARHVICPPCSDSDHSDD